MILTPVSSVSLWRPSQREHSTSERDTETPLRTWPPQLKCRRCRRFGTHGGLFQSARLGPASSSSRILPRHSEERVSPSPTTRFRCVEEDGACRALENQPDRHGHKLEALSLGRDAVVPRFDEDVDLPEAERDAPSRVPPGFVVLIED